MREYGMPSRPVDFLLGLDWMIRVTSSDEVSVSRW